VGVTFVQGNCHKASAHLGGSSVQSAHLGATSSTQRRPGEQGRAAHGQMAVLHSCSLLFQAHRRKDRECRERNKHCCRRL
jgi:hypothetical protein